MTQAAPTPLRCAVYTRKSSEEGLDMAFNSLDAQREAGFDYIKSQRHTGWSALPLSYDDGGYSGGTVERPGLQRLLDDIGHGKVDIVVVYKVDRLSRSLADFARLMQTFDEQRVSFVSVTQQFNTTTSMGRLTLNMLLSFAQFEREVAGERIRDKIAATYRRGIYVVGQPPLGYRRAVTGEAGAEERALVVIPEQAAIVGQIYAQYLHTGSLLSVAQRVNADGHRTKRWTSGKGRTTGGHPFTAALVYRILTNPLYVGKVTHTRRVPGVHGAARGELATQVYDGLHVPIINPEVWERVQAKMGVAERNASQRWTHTHLLKGKLRTHEGHAMSPGSVQRPGAKGRGGGGGNSGGTGVGGGGGGVRVHRYYVSQKAIKQGYAACPIKTLSAVLVDDLIRGLVLDHLKSTHALDLSAQDPASRDQRLRDVVERVTIGPEHIEVTLADARIAALVASDKAAKPIGSAKRRPPLGQQLETPTGKFTPTIGQRDGHTVLTLAIQLKRHDGRRLIVSAEGHDLRQTLDENGSPVPRDHIVRAIGLAFAWREELLRSGVTIRALAKRQRVTGQRVLLLITLTQLSPAILRAALAGTLPPSVALNDLVRVGRQLCWTKQMAELETHS
ncbi:hypothetical protein BH11PLA1_BH11PLA1_18420 [soil metagenome]